MEYSIIGYPHLWKPPYQFMPNLIRWPIEVGWQPPWLGRGPGDFLVTSIQPSDCLISQQVCLLENGVLSKSNGCLYHYPYVLHF